jgi:GntR family transcriptional regulator, transcriptional repressor for pyruvate dehydrogenase complex
MFSPVGTRESLSNIVSAEIEKAIISREYPPGSKLPSENELCRQFGVSRTSVREALRSLNAHGMINIIKGKGVFVKDINTATVTDPLQKYLRLKLDRNYVMDLVHARQIIEPGIAYYASLNRTKEDLVQLENDLATLDDCEEGVVEFARLDMSFHLHLANASQNSVIPLILDPIHRLTPELTSVYAAVSNAKQIAQEWHKKILKAVINKEAEKARKFMIEHLKIAEIHAEKMLEAQQKTLKENS